MYSEYQNSLASKIVYSVSIETMVLHNFNHIGLFPVSCPDLSPIANGTVSVSTNGSYTVATHSCDLGFTLAGRHTLTCADTGTWEGTQPSCGKVICTVVFVLRITVAGAQFILKVD